MTNLADCLRSLEVLDLITLETNETEPVHAFKHIFTQETIYNSLLLADRQQLHLQVGDALENIYHSSATATGNYKEINEAALLLAFHFEEGGDSKRAIKYLMRAAAKANADYANQEAKSLYEQALSLLDESAYTEQWDILANLERILDRLGEREEQEEALSYMQRLAELIGDNTRLAMTHNRWAVLHDKLSAYQAAADAAQLGLTVAQRAHNVRLEAESLNMMALAAWRRFDYEAVKQYANQALDALHISGDPLNRINSLTHLGKASYRLGQYDAALDYIQAAQDLVKFTRNPEGEANGHLILGWIYQRLGDYKQAERQYYKVLDIRRRMGDLYGEATALSHLGWLAYDQDNYEAGLEYCRAALETSESIGDRENLAYSLSGLALNYEQLGQLKAAQNYYYEALQLHNEIGATTLAIFDQAGLARIAMLNRDYNTAQRYNEQITAWITAGKAQQFWDPWSIYLSAYQVLMALDEVGQAYTILHEAHSVLQQRATEISDKALRERFLQEVTVNREIQTAWQIHQS